MNGSRKMSAALLLALAAGSAVNAAQLIQNGGFEQTGAEVEGAAGWSTASEGVIGAVWSTGAAQSPASGWDTAGAASGSFYALIDASQPSHNTLYQGFSTGAVSAATLNFSLFVNSQQGQPIVQAAAGLDFTTGDDNQHARVDLLAAGSDPFDTGAGVLRSFDIASALAAAGAGSSPAGYTTFSFDLGQELAAGGSYVLRFANVSNRSALQLGVDDVSLAVTAVPEPQTWALMLLGAAGLSFVARRRR